jgi:hypothetical protein
MSKLFEQYLVRDLGITETRAPELAEAMDTLHRALCQMDIENIDKVHQVGLGNLMRTYSDIEKVKDVMPPVGIIKW